MAKRKIPLSASPRNPPTRNTYDNDPQGRVHHKLLLGVTAVASGIIPLQQRKRHVRKHKSRQEERGNCNQKHEQEGPTQCTKKCVSPFPTCSAARLAGRL